MKILITGANGQLGHDVIKRLDVLGIACRGVDIDCFDITDKKAAAEYISEYAPAAVIHCAAYTAVDKSEENRELCYNINVNGTKNIAQACADIGAKMLYVSSDYVFGGQGSTPMETDSPTGPLGVYGKTKLQGEDAVKEILKEYFIVRTSWIFGLNGSNFVKTMLKLAESKKEINVVNDQFGSPTYTVDLAKLICDIIVTDKFGTYHVTNEGYCSWSDFAATIFEYSGVGVKVSPIPTEQYKTPAVRPKNSRMSKKSLEDAGFEKLPCWNDALKRYLDEIKV